MISRSRGLIGPSFAARSALGNAEGAGKAGRRPAPAVCVCSAIGSCTTTCRAARTSRPSLREWFDGLCRALPGAEFLWPPLPCEKLAVRAGWPQAASARRDCGDDSQDHTVLPYAACAFVTRGRVLTRFGSILASPCSPTFACRRKPASTAAHPRTGRLAIRPSCRVR